MTDFIAANSAASSLDKLEELMSKLEEARRGALPPGKRN